MDAYEDVTVPAGTFKAFRIVQTIAMPAISYQQTLQLSQPGMPPASSKFVKLDAAIPSL